MDIYFTQKFPRAENFYEVADGRIVAAAQTFLYNALIGGKSVKVSYLSGLGVLPDYRGRGLAESLIRRVLQSDAERGAALSFLIPGNESLREFYRQERHGGYETCTYTALYEITEKSSALPVFDIRLERTANSALYDFYLRTLSHGGNTLLPEASDFFAALSTCCLDGGSVVAARRGEETVGLALVRPDGDGGIRLTDFATTDSETATAMTAWMRREWHAPSVSLLTPCRRETPGSRPYAMARILSTEIPDITTLGNHALRLPMMLDE